MTKVALPTSVPTKEPDWSSASGVLLQGTRKVGTEWGMEQARLHITGVPTDAPEYDLLQGIGRRIGTDFVWETGPDKKPGLELMRAELFMINRRPICAQARQHLAAGRSVVSDRSYISTFVTNNVLPRERLIELAREAGVLAPDALIVIYAEPEAILLRINATQDKGRYVSPESIRQQVDAYRNIETTVLAGLPEDLRPRQIIKADFSKGDTPEQRQANLTNLEQALRDCGVLDLRQDK